MPTPCARLSEHPLAEQLLAWYDRARRQLPWRAAPGMAADPYAVWISEIMLQQTTVAAVGPYFRAFLGRWPSIESLAAAPLDDVLHAWQGLGYYARARNLHAAAQAVVRDWHGRLPHLEAELRTLPGIGAYTAAAVAAIAFGERATPVDGNVVRVVARLFAIAKPLPAARRLIEAQARQLTPAQRSGDFAQAMMDLGATVCLPRQPLCRLCPWRDACLGHAGGRPEALPVRAAKPERPTRHGVAFWAERADGAVLFRRRPEKGLLGGMMEVPSTDWRAQPWELTEALVAAPLTGAWRLLPGAVEHTFTHFHLVLQVVKLIAPATAEASGAVGLWVAPARFTDLALPTLMRKAVRQAQAAAAPVATHRRSRAT
ncbi:A/G-specific adenine glycosylase [Defluviicoccus vanus]|uniref:Adenine DNA glycosylase n=1 Tax=Defluviicoccus vanus TaxID=111831 RepID=A0A7H1N252_9PROT|nr:A/G-specific adenine glycosylase [Defluviicoccus vanus]QNT69788.1 A/G-specific adenine glycosylase [Defluviicoccus vanus]